MILETERLILRNWRESDVDCYMALAHDIGYNCFSPPGAYLVHDAEGARRQIRRRMALFEQRQMAKFPIFLRDTGEFIGTYGLEPAEVEGQSEIELGYRLCLKYWGSGYATEAATAVLRYGFGDLNLRKIVAFTVQQNRASVKILQKLGFRYEREFLHAGLPHRLYETTRARFAT
ncbi:MAG TPA: GNAT family N-acetyltransferase [Candidatus Polarisedimenticolia bacterium]|nr:GNAT family N-acetyltransferase [Candidatus Polarisedimenticolia bacterium]